jgi:tRNA(fMet)-specific endonuclease VapC
MPHQPVAVTIITFEEQMRGWLAFVARAKTIERQIIAYRKLHELEDDFETRLILDFDEQAAIEYRGLLRRRLRIGTMDTKIAAIALAQRATLITRNLVDFRKVPGLDAQDWTT